MRQGYREYSELIQKRGNKIETLVRIAQSNRRIPNARLSLCQIRTQHPLVRWAHAKRKSVAPPVSEAFLPSGGQSGVPIVYCQHCNDSGDGPFSGEIVGRLDIGQPYEDVAIWTLHV